MKAKASIKARGSQVPQPLRYRPSTKTIAEEWRDYEARTGRKMRMVSAYPLVGRGSVVRDWVSSAEAERLFRGAERIPVCKRLQWSLEDLLYRVFKPR